MAEADAVVVAANGTRVEAGGLYLTFSGDDEAPYALVKVVSVGLGPGEAAMDCRIGPDLVPVPSPDLWLKLYRANLTEPPAGLSPAVLAEGFAILPVSAEMFLAWGPPQFPVRVGFEAVSREELSAMAAGRHKPAEPVAAADGPRL